MSERQPNDTRGSERQDFDDESNLDTAHDSRALGERALAIALRELGPEKVTEIAAQQYRSPRGAEIVLRVKAIVKRFKERSFHISGDKMKNRETSVMTLEPPAIEDLSLDSQLLDAHQLLPGEYGSYYPIQVPTGLDTQGDSVTIKIPISDDTSARLDVVKRSFKNSGRRRNLSAPELGTVYTGYRNLASEAVDYESRVKDAIETLKAKKESVQKEIYENTMQQLQYMLEAAAELHLYTLNELYTCAELVRRLPSELGELYSFGPR